MLASTFAVVAALATFGVHPDQTGSEWSRQRLLATPRPYPIERADSPARLEHGRLWVTSYPVGSRTPAASRTLYEPGPGHYGVSSHHLYANLHVRLANTQIIALSPWERLEAQGLKQFERARNIWLREQGLILNVRTHVNARYLRHSDERAAGAHGLPTPRATIRVHPRADEPESDRWASANRPDVLATPMRVVAPGLAPNLPPRVIAPSDSALASGGE